MSEIRLNEATETVPGIVDDCGEYEREYNFYENNKDKGNIYLQYKYNTQEKIDTMKKLALDEMLLKEGVNPKNDDEIEKFLDSLDEGVNKQLDSIDPEIEKKLVGTQLESTHWTPSFIKNNTIIGTVDSNIYALQDQIKKSTDHIEQITLNTQRKLDFYNSQKNLENFTVKSTNQLIKELEQSIRTLASDINSMQQINRDFHYVQDDLKKLTESVDSMDNEVQDLVNLTEKTNKKIRKIDAKITQPNQSNQLTQPNCYDTDFAEFIVYRERERKLQNKLQNIRDKRLLSNNKYNTPVGLDRYEYNF